MSQEIGESREKWGWDVWHKAEDIANHNKNLKKPFYIIFSAKEDRYKRGVFHQSFLTDFSRPKPAFGQLVWFVDNAQGIFELVSDLSLPPDIPVDPSLLSDKPEDQLFTVMEKGKQHNALVS